MFLGVGLCCDGPDRAFWRGLEKHLERWAGKVLEYLVLSELVCGNLEDTASRTVDGECLACEVSE